MAQLTEEEFGQIVNSALSQLSRVEDLRISGFHVVVEIGTKRHQNWPVIVEIDPETGECISFHQTHPSQRPQLFAWAIVDGCKAVLAR